MKKIIAFTMAMAIAPSAWSQSPRNTIPSSCLAQGAHAEMVQQIPVALDLGPDAATVTSVTLMSSSDMKRRVYYPAMNGQPDLYILQCPVQVSWSNGHREIGFFSEWEDHRGQLRVSFGESPAVPN